MGVSERREGTSPDDEPSRTWPACIASALATLCILLASMAWCGIVPFGDHPFLSRDGAIQYVGLYGWYHNVLAGDASLTYSWAKGLGGGTYGMWAYYLSSPLSLLAAFFEPQDSALLFSVLVPAKLCLASASCAFWLCRRVGACPRSCACALGCAYALSAWSFVDGSNVMWLDGLALAPLAALGCWRVASGRSPATLCATLAAAVVFNWYTGYMLCVFSCVMVVAEVAIAPRPRAAGIVHLLARGALAILLGACAGAAVLVPTAFEQMGTSSTVSDSGLVSTLLSGVAPLNPLDLFAAMADPSLSFGGATNAVNIPCALVVFAAAMVFMPGLRREKVVLCAVLALLVLCACVKPLDMVWTGFVRADAYNPRWWFVFNLLLCLCAAMAFARVGLLGRGARSGSRLEAAAQSPVLRCGACSVVCVLLVLGSLLIAVRGLSSTALNGYGANSASEYASYMAALDEAADAAYSGLGPDDFCRMGNAASTSVAAISPEAVDSSAYDLTPMMTSCESMALGIPGLAHYTSTGSSAMKELLGNLGYCTLPGTRGVTSYNSPLLLGDSLLGVGYVLSAERPPGCVGPVADVGFPEAAGGGASLWENPHALALGYAVSAEAGDVAWGDDPFSNQEALLSELTGEPAKVYSPAEVVEVARGEGADADGERAWRVTASGDGPLYLRAKSGAGTVLVSADGVPLQTSGSYEFDGNVICLGDHAEGDVVEVGVSSSGSLGEGGIALAASTLDEGKAAGALGRLREHALTITEMEDGRLEGEFDLGDNEALLLTVPCDNGWSVEVDGAPASVASVNGLMLVSAPEGGHSLSMSYKTPGLKAGAAVSAAAVAAMAAWIAASSRKEARHAPRRKKVSSRGR